MIYLGVDPSFTKTGICLFNCLTKSIVFNTAIPEGTNDTYKITVERSEYIAEKVIETIYKHVLPSCSNSSLTLVFEEPLKSSIKASSLGILSGVFYHAVSQTKEIERIFVIPPHYVSWLAGPIAKREKLAKKTASRSVAEQLLYLLESKGYTISIINDKIDSRGRQKKRKISHDELEALLLAFQLINQENQLVTEPELLNISKNFKESKINQVK